MASSSIHEVSPSKEPSGEQGQNWLALPVELMEEILSRLGVIDILGSAQMVCKSWFEIFQNPNMWRTIDLRNPNDDPPFYLHMCYEVVERSNGQLVDVNLEYFGFEVNALLKFITDSSRQIKRLGLARCYYSVSEKKFIAAISKLPLLEELDLTLCFGSVAPIKALRYICRRLTSLKWNCQSYRVTIEPGEELKYNEEALAIAENLTRLRHLQLIGNTMTNIGLEAILDGCPNLESLDLRRCLNINLNGEFGRRCIERIRNLRLPHDSLEDYRYPADPDDEDRPFHFVVGLSRRRGLESLFGSNPILF